MTMRIALCLAVCLLSLAAGCDRAPSPTATGEVDGADPATFFGLPVAERRVVFAVTRAGGMMDQNQGVKERLKQTIEQLSPDQRFHVIFWGAGPAEEMPGGMAPATPENKSAAAEFIDPIVPRGANDPEYGLRAAFASQPDAIYLLAYGEFDRAIAQLVGTLNEGGKVTVNVVHVVTPGNKADAGAEPLVRGIAENHGGAFVAVSRDRLMPVGDQTRAESATP
jgi:hypothetical protein